MWTKIWLPIVINWTALWSRIIVLVGIWKASHVSSSLNNFVLKIDKYTHLVSKRCIPFNYEKSDFDMISNYLATQDLGTAIDNLKLVANMQGVLVELTRVKRMI